MSKAYPQTSRPMKLGTVLQVVAVATLVLVFGLSLASTIGVFTRTGCSSLACHPRPANPQSSLRAAISFGMNTLGSSPGFFTKYGKTLMMSLFGLSETEYNSFAGDARNALQALTGLSFTVDKGDGVRETANGVFAFKPLTTDGPYRVISVRDNTGYLCEGFEDGEGGDVVLAEFTVTFNATLFATTYPSGFNYAGTFVGPAMNGDAWAYGIYRNTQGTKVRQWLMKSAQPGRAINGNAGFVSLLLNENFRTCSREYGPGMQTLQVILDYIPDSDSQFRVSLLNQVRFEPMTSVSGMDPWVDCDNPLG